jgi:hypothetical protein
MSELMEGHLTTLLEQAAAYPYEWLERQTFHLPHKATTTVSNYLTLLVDMNVLQRREYSSKIRYRLNPQYV